MCSEHVTSDHKLFVIDEADYNLRNHVFVYNDGDETVAGLIHMGRANKTLFVSATITPEERMFASNFY